MNNDKEKKNGMNIAERFACGLLGCTVFVASIIAFRLPFIYQSTTSFIIGAVCFSVGLVLLIICFIMFVVALSNKDDFDETETKHEQKQSPLRKRRYIR